MISASTPRSRADYPDQALPVAEAVARGEHEFGILVCGTGIGMSISANKVPGDPGRRLQRYVLGPPGAGA